MRKIAILLLAAPFLIPGCFRPKEVEDRGPGDSRPGDRQVELGRDASRAESSIDQSKPPTCARKTWSWTAAAPMVTPRRNHSAVRLIDGRVLVVGGQGDSTPRNMAYIASAEIYDPAARSWSPAGKLAVARHTLPAVLLQDGRVLVAGGYNFGSSAVAELFDGKSWQLVGPMKVDRYGHALAVLPNGEVLAAGGYSDKVGDYQSSAEIFNPGTKQWRLVTSMPMARHRAYWAVLRAGAKQGHVLLAGGEGAGGMNYLSSAVTFDPGKLDWSQAPSMPASRSEETGEHPAAAALKDGRVLIAGHSDGTAIPASAIFFDQSLGWLYAPPMSCERRGGTLTVLADETVVAVGCMEGNCVATAEAYDPALNQWLPRGVMAGPRHMHTATALLDGSLLACGGAGAPTIAACELLKERWVVAEAGGTPSIGAPLGTRANGAVANSWKAACDTEVAAVRLGLWKAGTNFVEADGVQLKLFSAGGTPERPETGTLLGTSTTVRVSSISTSIRSVGFTFSPPIPVAAGATYYWVAYRTTSLSDESFFWVSTSSMPYSDGDRWDSAGGVWVRDDQGDFYFEIHSS